jgi:hypothetical protein
MRLLSVLASVTLIAACSTTIPVAEFATGNGADEHFAGVADLLRQDGPVDVIFVHGMCTHDATWPAEAVQTLYEALGGTGDVALDPAPVEGTGITLYQKTLTVPGGTLRANAILWSPLTTPLKAQLCYDQTRKSPGCPPAEAAKAYPYPRATLNRILKDGILDDCLADAVIYQGMARDDISGQMQRAIVHATATSGGAAQTPSPLAAAAAVPDSIPLVIIAESLGSKVAFDALWKLIANDSTAAAGQRTFDRTAQIFMEANQLPILALADKGLDGVNALRPESAGASGGGYPVDPLASLIRVRRANIMALDGKPRAAPQVVAFTDPNDLLSYILAPGPHSQAAGYPVVDVVLSNDRTYLGLAELPTTAHTGYGSNKAVQRFIACGHRTTGGCGGQGRTAP